MNQIKSELYEKAKSIKDSHKDCFTGISGFNKKELLYYIQNCGSEFREEVLNDDLFAVDQKICKRTPINQENQNLFDEYIFNSDLNLDLIEIKPTIINIDLDFDSDIYLNIRPRTEYLKFYKIKNIGSGTYGSIFLFYNFDYKIAIALKKELKKANYNNMPIEEGISNLLNDGVNCDTLRVKFIKQDIRSSYYILKKLEGDLYSLVEKLNEIGIDSPVIKNIKLNIAEEVRRQVVCLYDIDNNFIYTDLKLGNILYGCPDKENLNEFKIHLGDLGSVVSDIDDDYVSTYLPFEFSQTHGHVKFDDEDQVNAFLSWLIGLVLLDLIENNESRRLLYSCTWDNIGDIPEEEFRNVCEEMKTLLEEYYEIPGIGDYLNFDPDDRPDFFSLDIN